MPYPVTPAESDTLSGRARRGLDRALAVGGGLGGGGMHRLGACRGGRGQGQGVARVAVEARRGDGAGLRRQRRHTGSDLRPEVVSGPLLSRAINVIHSYDTNGCGGRVHALHSAHPARDTGLEAR